MAQRRSYAKLSLERIQLLRGVHNSLAQQIDSWMDPLLKWKRSADQLNEFVGHHGCLPSFTKNDIDQARLAGWIKRQCYRKALLSGEQLAYFRGLHPLIQGKLAGPPFTKQTAIRLLKSHEMLRSKLANFVQETDRLPSYQGKGSERHLYRSFYKHVKRVSCHQEFDRNVNELRSLHPTASELIDTWISSESTWKKMWKKRCVELSRFLENHKRLPRRKSAQEEERRLASWFEWQIFQLHRLNKDEVSNLRNINLLVSERVDRALNPGLLWRKRYGECATFITTNQCLPKVSAADEHQTSLYVWLMSSQRRAIKNRRLSLEQIQELKTLHPDIARLVDRWFQSRTIT